MDIRIDPEFQALIRPLKTEEYTQLETNIQSHGCLDSIKVWIADEVPIILDGHNRYEICQKHGLAFNCMALEFDTRYDAMQWIIDNQYGRRNQTTEELSYLRGKWYNLEKLKQGAPEGNENARKQSDQNEHFVLESVDESNAPPAQKTRERLAEQFGVGAVTIQRDADFAKATDTLEREVRKDLRDLALKRSTREKTQKPTTKAEVVKAGKAIADKRVEPLPFMKRANWKDFQVLEAITLMAGENGHPTISLEEQQEVNALLDAPYIPPSEGLGIIRNLVAMTASQRNRIFTLHKSPDSRDQNLALSEAAKKKPAPDPQALLATQLISSVDDVRQAQRRWMKMYPGEAWEHELIAIDASLSSVQEQWRGIKTRIQQAYQERIDRNVQEIRTHD